MVKTAALRKSKRKVNPLDYFKVVMVQPNFLNLAEHVISAEPRGGRPSA